MRRWLSAFCCLAVLWPSFAFGQAAVLQGGNYVGGHVPIYSNPTFGQPIVTDGGAASGGGPGVGLSELNITARGTGTGPYAGQGTGPLGTLSCMQDNPSSTANYHYLCFSPNAQGGGLLAYGAAGTASQLPLAFNINGQTYQFPFSIQGILGPTSSLTGDVACWNNTNGTLLKDCGSTITLQGTGSGALTLSAPATASGALTLPNGPDTLVGRASADTLTNKTLTSPTINGGTITSPTIATATINTATINSGSMGAASTATTQTALDNSTKLATTAYVDSAVSGGIPVGVCMAYGGASAPAGWLLAFGQAISRTTFASLFAVYATTFGIGDGSTTFNMPDLRGRVPAGRDDMGGSSASRLTATSMTPNGTTLGAVGGAQTNGTSTAVAFTSTGSNAINFGNPSFNAGSIAGSGGFSTIQGAANGSDFNAVVNGGTAAVSGSVAVNGNFGISVSGGGTFGSAAFGIVQPTLIMNTICKTQ